MVVVPIVVVSTVVVAVVFLLVTTCHFKDTSWVSLFEAGKWVVTYVVAHFCDAPPGSPTSWVPPGVLHSQKLPSSNDEPPTSLWRGEGQAGILAGDAGNRTHIHQQKGGASGRV